MEDEVVRRNDGITPGQILAVIFGRKWIFLGVFAFVFLISILYLKLFYEKSIISYECTYVYTSEDLNNNLYPNGQSFKPAELLSMSNLNAIKNGSDDFQNINVDGLYAGGANLSLIDSEHKIYKLTLKRGYFKNKTQAIKFAKTVIEQPNKVIADQIKNANTDTYLKLYDGATVYENQVIYLNQQRDKILNNYENIISAFGDIKLKDGTQLSAAKLNFENFFENYSFSSLTDEIRSNGYVKDYTNYKTTLESEEAALKIERALDVSKLNDLTTQRDQILTAAGSLQTLELTEYNEKIIELTLRIYDIDEELNVIAKKLGNIDKAETDDDYKAKIKDLNARLAFFREKLGEFTIEYSKYATEATESHSFVSYANSQVLTETSGMKIYLLIGIPTLLGLVVAALVNIVIDGKKLTSKYRLVPVEMIKDEKEVKIENKDKEE